MDPTDNQSPTVKPRRRVPLWFLWTLAAVMLFVSLFVGFWLPWQRRLQVIKEIESLGGTYRTAGSPGPEWIRELFGHHYHGLTVNSKIGPFDDVVEIYLDSPGPKRGLNRELSFGFVARLAQFPNLKRLDLSFCDITDDWMPYIARLQSLEQLAMNHGRISERELASLRSLTRLKKLNLSYGNATDDWMPRIAQLRSLEQLDLSHSRISGRGFAALQSLPRLEGIDLSYCPIRDPGLEHLVAIPTLKTINVFRCSHLTDSAAQKFTADRPDCDLYREH